MVTGKDLIRLGYELDEWFKTVLDTLNTVRKVWDDEEIKSYRDTLVPEPIKTLGLLDKSVPFRCNTEGRDTLDEIENGINLKELID